MFISVFIFIAVLLSFLLGFFLVQKSSAPNIGFGNGDAVPSDVGQFYNETTDKFLAVYGEIIQAFRTKDVDSYLNYTAQNLELKEGMTILDAGCGVCGPASHFAKQFENIRIDACSISSVQIEKAKEKVNSFNLQEKVFPQVLDYHTIHEFYPTNHFDRVYFLESYGHSNDKKSLLHAAWDVLKPEGKVYIKDLFRRESENEWEQQYIDKICGEIDEAYKYHIGSLHETIAILRQKGFILHYVKIPEIKIDEFEHLTISNDFQNLFDIGKIDSWDDYIFPIDFYEILAEKPKVMSLEEKHLYFMNRK